MTDSAAFRPGHFNLWCRAFGHVLSGCTWQVSPRGFKTFYGYCGRCGYRSYAEGEFERVMP